MKVIITMAGEGKRFSAIGISKPKYKIIANNKSLLEWSLLSLMNFFHEEFIFVVKSDIYDKEFIFNICRKLRIHKYHIKVLDEKTNGQGTTAYLADEFVGENESCIVYNIDTSVRPNAITKEDIKDNYDGFIPVIKAEGDRWSFVKLDECGNVVDVAEKIPISNLATIGFYYFKQWKMYKKFYMQCREEILKTNKEVYIAPMYKRMIDNDMNVRVKLLNVELVNILGTPEEIEEFDTNYYRNNI